MKEQLIRELVKNDRESRQLNEQYQNKIYTLQQEKENAYTELNNLQMALKENETKEKNDKVKKDHLHVLVYVNVHLHTILPCIRVHSDRMRCDFFVANNRMRFTHASKKINETHVIQ